MTNAVRSKEEILKALLDPNVPDTFNKLLLEVLIDIRDELIRRRLKLR